MRYLTLAVVFVLAPATGAAAQHFTAGVQYAFADYAEQGSSLRFGGGGPSGNMSVSWRRLGASFAATRLAVDPAEGAGGESFDITQIDVRLRVRATRLVTVEAGLLERDVNPLHAAQSLSALRLGAVAAFPLATGSDVAVRASYLGGSRFSGGGSAPFGVEIGLGASYAPWSERVRFTGDLEFQRLDRRIASGLGDVGAPIQSTMARLGVAFVH